MTKQKNPKVGDTVGWAIVLDPPYNSVLYLSDTRKKSRDWLVSAKGSAKTHARIAKIVLSK